MPPRATSLLKLALCGLVLLAGPSISDGRHWIVDAAHRDASDEAPGSSEAPLRTISRAAAQAEPGDTILVLPGIYREHVQPARSGTPELPIVYQAATGGAVIVRGSNAWAPAWEERGPSIVYGAFDPAVFGDQNPFLREVMEPATRIGKNNKRTAIHSLGEVFLDGAPLVEVRSRAELERQPLTWMLDPGRKGLLLHLPRDRRAGLLEVAVRPRLFAPYRRGLSHIHVRGFIFEHCANDGVGAFSTRSGRHWRIEHNTIRFAKTLGIDVGSETWKPELLTDTAEEDRRLIIGGGHWIAGNTISDNGLVGLWGWTHKGTVITGNIFERNNRLRFFREQEHAALKVHHSDVRIEGNLFRDNHAWAVWLDNRNEDARVTRNLFVNNAMGAVFVELTKEPSMVDHNIVIGSRAFGTPSVADTGEGLGLYVQDASLTTIAHNLFLDNAEGGIRLRTLTKRIFRDGTPVAASNNRILGNILGGHPFAISLPFPNPRDHGNRSDFNVFLTTDPFRLSWERIPPPERETLQAPHPGMDWKHLQPSEWRALSGQDVQSLFGGNLSYAFDAEQLILTVHADKVEALPAFASLAEVDYAGRPIPAGRALPGPFQFLTNGTHRIPLWPVTPALARDPSN